MGRIQKCVKTVAILREFTCNEITWEGENLVIFSEERITGPSARKESNVFSEAVFLIQNLRLKSFSATF